MPYSIRQHSTLHLLSNEVRALPQRTRPIAPGRTRRLYFETHHSDERRNALFDPTTGVRFGRELRTEDCSPSEAPTLERPSPSQSIRVLVVDDHGIVRDGLTVLLERHGQMKVCGSAATGKEAVLSAARIKPDVVVMDLMLPELSGIDATERILRVLPQTRIVVLSICHTSEHVFRALRAGARGYVTKDAAGAELVRAVVAVFNGERYLSPKITEMVIGGLLDSSAPHSPLESLSSREREVLHLTVAGSSSAEIAHKLSLSRKTVDTYRSRVMTKLGVPDLAGLIHFAVEHAMTPA
jgi:DNA-binding NarL/FixJ family response regulator